MDSINDSGLKFIHVMVGNFYVCDLSKYTKLLKKAAPDQPITINKKYILKIKTPFQIQFPQCTDSQRVWFCRSRTSDPPATSVPIVFARCRNSMKILDKLHREYVQKGLNFENKKQIVAIKSVAGSGKTTTLLQLAQRHTNKKILYLAFNRSLIEEIRGKLESNGIRNMTAQTFDSLMRDVYIHNNDKLPNLIELKHTTIADYHPFFAGKNFQLRKSYVGYYQKFCNQTGHNDIKKFCQRVLGGEKRLLVTMWEDTLTGKYHTFDSLRKLAQINRWSRGYLDKIYDMVFIDEAQDFDPLMLHILLNDVNLPKVFVGDPRQAIYEWRGCINSFDRLPPDAMTIEFYSTFRVGEPACKVICKAFEDCWMISRSQNKTHITSNHEFGPEEDYVYLFRTWKCLLLTAAKMRTKVWIHNFEPQIEFIKKLHQKLQYSDLSKEEREEFSDDLPAFLIKLTYEDLDDLLTSVKGNYTNNKSKAKCHMYTIHTFKGLEHDRVKIHDDIKPEEENLKYVALTRGKKEVVIMTAAD